MKLVFAPDSFKGSLSADEICQILTCAAKRIFPEAETVSLPVADGGEGTVDALLMAVGGQRLTSIVTGPLMTPVEAIWGILPNGTAVIEMAQASGLSLVARERRDPRFTTSLGVGELIAKALRHGARHLVIGIGGSATNDGGMGLLTALGAVFTDQNGAVLPPVGSSLGQVADADFSNLLPELQEAELTVLCDVTNPLLGENGATYIYGPQKGASPEICRELEAGMTQYASVLSNKVGRDIAAFSGAGAAGGLGAALGGILGAAICPGIDTVLKLADFDGKLEGASLVITGEGRMDSQSIRYGKVPVGVAKRCALRGVPVAAIVGGIGDGAEGFFDICESVVLPTAPGPIHLEQAISNARILYDAAADRLFRAIRIGMSIAAQK